MEEARITGAPHLNSPRVRRSGPKLFCTTSTSTALMAPTLARRCCWMLREISTEPPAEGAAPTKARYSKSCAEKVNLGGQIVGQIGLVGLGPWDWLFLRPET